MSKSKLELELKVSFDEVLEKLKDGDEKSFLEAVQLEAEKRVFHALFYAPSSPLTPQKAQEAEEWYWKFKGLMESKKEEIKKK